MTEENRGVRIGDREVPTAALENQLESDRARLALVLEASGLGTWELDLRTGASPRRSARHDRIFGYEEPREDWSFETFLEHVHPEDRAHVGHTFQTAVEAGTGWEFECRIQTVTGALRWIWARGLTQHGPDGLPLRLLGVVGDVTERKQTEQTLRASEGRLRLALDIAGLGTWEWDLRTGEGVLDDRGAEIVGLPPGPLNDVAGAQMAAIHPVDIRGVEAAIAAGLERGGTFDLEYRVLRPTGRVGYVHSRARVVTDAAGRPVQLWGTNRDVTQERETEERQAFLLALTDTLRPLTDPMEVQYGAARLLGAHLGANRVGYALDRGDGEMVEVARNYTDGVPGLEGVYRYEDYGPELLRELRAGRTVVRSDIAEDPTLTDAEKAAHAALQLGATVNVPLLKDGHLRAILFLHHREPRAWSAAEVALLEEVADRTWAAVEQARTEVALREAKEVAEQANRSKSEFLAVMSHELRTPLNAIAGYVELLEMGIHGLVTEAQRRALGRIQNSQQHLLGLINEVLNYARLESGAVNYQRVEVSVRELFAATEALIEPQAQARGLTLRVEECDPAVAVCADPEKLRQILLNLASNAVKFTDPGGQIEICCEVHSGWLDLRVRDTGLGISADQLEAIFEPFVQVRADLTRTAEGTGLGLTISRDLARGMGGDLTVESAPGEGSVFTVRLPREAVKPGAE